MKIIALVVSSALLLTSLPRAMGQSTEQFLALYNMTSFFFERDPGLARRLVRMAFHDAMGGVDAHLDTSNDEHRGLNRTLSFLNRLWRHSPMQNVCCQKVGIAGACSWHFVFCAQEG